MQKFIYNLFINTSMKPFVYLRFLMVWCVCIHVFDVWSTYQLSEYYGWEGELNLLVKDFISESFFHMVLLKFMVVGPCLWIASWLWDSSFYYDDRHWWAIRIMLFYNLFASGIMCLNLYWLIRMGM